MSVFWDWYSRLLIHRFSPVVGFAAIPGRLLFFAFHGNFGLEEIALGWLKIFILDDGWSNKDQQIGFMSDFAIAPKGQTDSWQIAQDGHLGVRFGTAVTEKPAHD
jgi:hypothetical protein